MGVQSDLLVVITGAGVASPSLLDHDVDVVYISLLVGLIRPMAKSFPLTIPPPPRRTTSHRRQGGQTDGLDALELARLNALRSPYPHFNPRPSIFGRLGEEPSP